MSLSICGKLPSGERLRRIKNSPNYKNGSFQNISKTNAIAEDASVIKAMRDFFNKPKQVRPAHRIPSVKTNLKRLPDDKITVIWFGHSSYLVKVNGKTILVDPVFSGNAAPVSFMVTAFKGSNEYEPEDFPEIDILLLTHDHYDHLDYKTVVALKTKVRSVVCPLGVGSHLEHWGFAKKIIHEMDWWETYEVNNMAFTAVPGRHFSGRGIKRGQTLWAAFVLKTKHCNLFLGGDSGYDTHFKTIGGKFGPFDLAILECGQYNTTWPNIHMMPEETAAAAVDLNARLLLPVHWGKFALSMHEWKEPINRLIKKAGEINLSVSTPKIGEALVFGEPVPVEKWWDFKSV